MAVPSINWRAIGILAVTLGAPALLAPGARGAAVTPYGITHPTAGLVLSSDQATLYGANLPASGPGTVLKIDVASGAVAVVGALKGRGFEAAISLSIGPDGMLYGVGTSGTKKNSFFLFSMNPATGKEKVLHGFAFNTLLNKGSVQSNLAFDAAGVIYGERANSVFRYDPVSDSFTTVHVFGTCGALINGLVFDAARGLFYGTAQACPGQGNGGGFVFSIDAHTGAENVMVYSGTEGVGGYPAGLALDSSGQLFVETQDGPGAQFGSVFKIDPGTGIVTPVYAFAGGAEGHMPTGAMAFGPDGMLYGAMEFGGEIPDGASTDNGTLWKLDVAHGTDTVFWTFLNRNNLKHPFGSIAVNGAGDLFGAVGEDLFAFTP